jgi:hypothetical protein
VYEQLKNDAEKYIFYTMMLQDYPDPSYQEARMRLNPKFGRKMLNLERMEVYTKNVRTYNDTTPFERINTLSLELLVAPTFDRQGRQLAPPPNNKCPPYKCTNLYEFTNNQLRELVEMGDVSLNEYQLSNYVSLYV